MRHAQRALHILIERLFFEEDSITNEERDDLACMHLSPGEVREVFRVFLRATFGDDEVLPLDRRQLIVIAQQLRLPEDHVPHVTFNRAA